ncbi:hypothetical protein CPBP_00527 [Candidatus Bodocaedibacter vickermanii]|uniref:Uncharacterized protein n=1 Tax=Candidatus Bodocaedibacter vickermanii TaxID=2741701 RepID=A0A7L9RT91_9PROT|nr:hypothetical protein CPBP_00527 [Candidatus Paracaedibacteraceae bacterium 'Lake Konstanz']
MNFSFLDISVKSPQDLYSWNRIKSTLLVNWYSFWRLILLVLVVLIIFFGTVIILDYPMEAIDLYMNTPWFEVLSIVVSTYITSIFTYGSLYKKNYISFNLTFDTPKPPQFWSWYFWKRNLLFACATILPGKLLEVNMLTESIFYGTSLLISHFCLHCGFWGIGYEPKQLNNHNDDITN